jgi:hypothetical protein
VLTITPPLAVEGNRVPDVEFFSGVPLRNEAMMGVEQAAESRQLRAQGLGFHQP